MNRRSFLKLAAVASCAVMAGIEIVLPKIAKPVVWDPKELYMGKWNWKVDPFPACYTLVNCSRIEYRLLEFQQLSHDGIVDGTQSAYQNLL